MSPKKGDAVAPPAVGDEWKIRFATNDAAKGWDELVATAPGSTRWAWDILRTDPGPGPGKPTPRHHRLRGKLMIERYGGRILPQWQIEVTRGGRIWYLLDTDRHTVWITQAGVGHPKITE